MRRVDWVQRSSESIFYCVLYVAPNLGVFCVFNYADSSPNIYWRADGIWQLRSNFYLWAKTGGASDHGIEMVISFFYSIADVILNKMVGWATDFRDAFE